jgi:hypothetical protein
MLSNIPLMILPTDELTVEPSVMVLDCTGTTNLEAISTMNDLVDAEAPISKPSKAYCASTVSAC